MPALIKKYNNLLLSMVSPDGFVTVLTDIVEIQSDEKLLQDINNLLSEKPIDTIELEHYAKKHGLDFANAGRYDLLSKISAKKILWAFWPFDEYKNYLVYGVTGKKNDPNQFK